MTTHEFELRPLSGLQWTALKILTAEARRGKTYFTAEEIAQYKQTTLGSFARRGYVVKVGENRFKVTDVAKRARSEFEAADVMRRAESMKLSTWFGKTGRVVAMRRAG